MKMEKIRISRKCFFALILSLTFLFMAVFVVLFIAKRNVEFSKKQYKTVAASIYETVKDEISKPIYTSLTMAKNSFLIDTLKHENDFSEKQAVSLMSEHLSLVKESMNAQTAFIVSEGSQRYYYHAGLNKIINPKVDEHDIWYTIFANTRKPYDLDVDTDQVNSDSWTVFVNTRIEDENKSFLGACGIGLSMKKLQDLLKDYEENYDLKVNFVNSDGLVQVDTDTVNIENSYLYDVQYGKEKDGYAYLNKNEYVIMRYVDDLNWYLVVRGRIAPMTFTEVMPVILVFVAGLVVCLLAFFMIYRKKTEN